MKYRALILTLLGVGATVPAFGSELTVKGLEIQPAEVVLYGARGTQQLVVTANPAAADIHDVTAAAEYRSEDPAVAVIQNGLVRAVGNGTTVIRAAAGGQEVAMKVTVQGTEQASPVAFHTEVLAALTKSGCNMGACHGSPSGKGGFRLSLRGYDPSLDLVTLRGEYFNRRSNVLNPDESLLLRKPLMEVAHGGGRRLGYNDPSHVVLKQWIGEGMKVEPEGTPALVSIEVFPKPRVLRDGADQQQLRVNGTFSDGTVRDITALTAFDTSDESIAAITPEGVVTREGRGEATILARYLDKMSTTQLTFLTERPEFQWPNPAEETRIVTLVFGMLRLLQLQPS